MSAGEYLGAGSTTTKLLLHLNGNSNDSSGNGNNGTVYGATLTTDRFGNANSANSFNGTNNYIEIPNSTSIDLSSNI